MTLQEFNYGFDQAKESENGSATERFYSNSLYQYFYNIFLADRSKSTDCFLNEIGSGDLIASIVSTLENNIGDQTVGPVIRAYRDKLLVHTLFTADQLNSYLQKRLCPPVHLDDPATSEAIRHEMFKLFSSTYNLYDNLLNRFPELRSHIRSI